MLMTTATGSGNTGHIFFYFLITRESLLDEQTPLVQPVLQPPQNTFL